MSTHFERFLDTAFISSGALDRMFTLRVLGEFTARVEDRVYTYTQGVYICNLSTDWDQAIEKANRVLTEDFPGVELKGELFTLQEIKRSTERMKQDERDAIEASRKEAYESWVSDQKFEFDVYISEGVFLFGKHVGKTITQVAAIDLSYIKFMSKQEPSQNTFGKGNATIQMCKNYLNSVELPNFLEYGFKNGQIVERLSLKKKTEMWFQGTYGMQALLILVDEKQREFKTYTTSKKLTGDAWKEGEMMNVTFEVNSEIEESTEKLNIKKVKPFKEPKKVK